MKPHKQMRMKAKHDQHKRRNHSHFSVSFIIFEHVFLFVDFSSEEDQLWRPCFFVKFCH